MTTKDEEKLHRPTDVQISDHHKLNLNTPSSDIDTLSDAGTYIIEDDIDTAQNNNSEQNRKSSSLLKRYVNPDKDRRGTFDIHGLVPPTTRTINRPIVDLHIPTHDESSSSSSLASSLISSPIENELNILKESEVSTQNKSSNSFSYVPNTLLQQRSITPPPPPPQNRVKPSECFGKNNSITELSFCILYFSYFATN